jgi:hypothetical protein
MYLGERIQQRALAGFVRSELQVSPDGTIAVSRWMPSGVEIVDLRGNVLRREADVSLESEVLRSVWLDSPHAEAGSAIASTVVLGFRRGGNGEAWYLLADGDGRSYLEGYAVDSKQLLGYVSRAGFGVKRPSGSERFQIDLGWITSDGQWATLGAAGRGGVYNVSSAYYYGNEFVYLNDAGNFWLFNLTDRSIKHLPTPSPVVSVGVERTRHSDRQPGGESGRKQRVRAIARTATELLIFDTDTLASTFRLPPETRGIPMTVYVLGEDLAVLEVGRNVPSSGERQVLRINAAGEVLSSDRVVIFSTVNLALLESTTSLIACIPSPLVLATTGWGVWMSSSPGASSGPDSDLRSGQNGQALSAGRSYAVATLIHLILAGVLAAWVYRRERHAGRAGRGWAFFVVLLGPPGLFGYYFHRKWPATGLCEACRQPIALQSLTCSACGEDVVQVVPIGSEVFA